MTMMMMVACFGKIFLTFIVGCNESQDVFVPQHDCLVDFGLSEPGALLSG